MGSLRWDVNPYLPTWLTLGRLNKADRLGVVAIRFSHPNNLEGAFLGRKGMRSARPMVAALFKLLSRTQDGRSNQHGGIVTDEFYIHTLTAVLRVIKQEGAVGHLEYETVGSLLARLCEDETDKDVEVGVVRRVSP